MAKVRKEKKELKATSSGKPDVTGEQSVIDSCLLKTEILTHTLGSHHAWDLGVGGGGGTNGVEGLWPGS